MAGLKRKEIRIKKLGHRQVKHIDNKKMFNNIQGRLDTLKNTK